MRAEVLSESAGRGTTPRRSVRVLVVDPHPIYRRGLVSCLASPGMNTAEAGSPAEALESDELRAAHVVLVDGGLPDVDAFIRDVRARTDAQVVVCSSTCREPSVLSSIEAGAVGYLSKETLTPEALGAAIDAAASGSGVMAPELLGPFLRSITDVAQHVLEPRGLSLARLSPRERRVLTLLADGLPTREVARHLSYSERTVKNVIHDVVTKLNARSRSQAIATAMREGLI